MKNAIYQISIRVILIALMLILALALDDILIRSTFHCVFFAPHKGFCYFW